MCKQPAQGPTSRKWVVQGVSFKWVLFIREAQSLARAFTKGGCSLQFASLIFAK